MYPAVQIHCTTRHTIYYTVDRVSYVLASWHLNKCTLNGLEERAYSGISPMGGGLSTRWGLKITWFHSFWGELSSHSLPSPKYASNWKCRRKFINLFKVQKTPFSYFWSDNNNSIQFKFRYIKLHTELHTIHLEIRPISSFCFFKNYINVP